MRIGTLKCKHCQSKYDYLYSGYVDGDFSKSLDYCITCFDAVTNALALIPVKFGAVYVKTNEVDIQTLKNWEIDWQNEHKQSNNILPIARRVFPTLTNSDFTAYKITNEIKGRDNFKGRSYIYSYWSNNEKDVTITVKKEVEYLIDGTTKELDYSL